MTFRWGGRGGPSLAEKILEVVLDGVPNTRLGYLGNLSVHHTIWKSRGTSYQVDWRGHRTPKVEILYRLGFREKHNSYMHNVKNQTFTIALFAQSIPEFQPRLKIPRRKHCHWIRRQEPSWLSKSLTPLVALFCNKIDKLRIQSQQRWHNEK